VCFWDANGGNKAKVRSLKFDVFLEIFESRQLKETMEKIKNKCFNYISFGFSDKLGKTPILRKSW